MTQRLSEVLAVFFQFHLGCDVEQAEKPEGTVDADAQYVGGGITQLELEKIVGQLGDIVQIGKKIAHPHLREFGHHFFVAGRHGF